MRLPVRSLVARLVLSAVGVQSLSIIVAMLVMPMLVPFISYPMIANGIAVRQISASLVQTGDGSVSSVGTPALQAYQANHPHMRFAVRVMNGGFARGSASDLIATLRRIGPFVPRQGSVFETIEVGREGDPVFITQHKSRVGAIVVATAGDTFCVLDLPSFAWMTLANILPIYSPLLLGVLFGIPLVVRAMFSPVGRAARAASLIDVRSLNQRLPVKGMPSEFLPFVNAINAALDRLSNGWTQQRVFIANAAHELRTPVAVLQARVETMRSDAPLRTALTRDARRLGLLIDQLLAISRLEQRDIALQPLDLVPLIRDLVADWAPVAIRGSVAIGFHAERPSIWILGEGRAIEGAVAALLDNALTVEPAGGTIEIEISVGAYVTVRDHGSGVELADRDAVFEPFWRKDERSSGSGLGLATVRETARLHNGHVRVDGGVAGGAVFRLFVPGIKEGIV